MLAHRVRLLVGLERKWSELVVKKGRLLAVSPTLSSSSFVVVLCDDEPAVVSGVIVLVFNTVRPSV